MTLPPGTILQLMYFKERLRQVAPGKFIEIGPGSGYLSACLLSLGWSGVGYELDAESADRAREFNQLAVDAGRYQVFHENWLHRQPDQRADLIVSSMVLEHLSDVEVSAYLQACHEKLQPSGLGVLFVPGSPPDWGIEDEIAGHLRRYRYADLRSLLQTHGYHILDMAGLTYPLSNLVLPVSNFLVRRSEGQKSGLSLDSRTRLSGRRDVLGKTRFPFIAGLVLNEYVLYPFHLLQKVCRNMERALVIYAEFSR